MKRGKFIIIILALVLLFSCDIELLEGEENVNDYIYPYLVFTPEEEGDGYTVTVVDGAGLEEIYIPSSVEVGGVTVPVTSFNGFENPEDAKSLKVLELGSTETAINENALEKAENLEDVKVSEEKEDAVWGEFPSIEKPGYEFDGWYIKDTEIRVNEGDRMIPGFTTLVPRWKNHTLTYHEKTAKTCTQNGRKAYYSCGTCKKLFSDETALTETTLDALVIDASHNLVFTEAEEATCTESGNREYFTCSVCALIFSDADAQSYLSPDDTVIPAKGHSPLKIEERAATCTEDGNTTYYRCERCNHLYEDEACTAETSEASTVVSALNHSWSYRYGERLSDGHWEECSLCHETRNSMPHTFGSGSVTTEPTHERAGKTTYICSLCSAVKTEDIMPIGDHNWVGKKTVAPTCEEQGYTLYRCTVSECDATYKSDYTDPAGHNTEYHAKENATCTTDGVEAYYECETCHKYFQDKEGKNEIDSPAVIPHSGHSWGSVCFIDEAKNIHYTKCTNTGCNERNESAHVYENITENRTPLKSRTCTTGAEYRKSCVCGKESTATFIDGKGYGHVRQTHEGVAANCSEKGHITYYTCSNECCSGKYYADEEMTTEVAYDSLVLDYASHVYTMRNFSKTATGHTYICDACHKSTTTENHTKTYGHNFYRHWWTCETCGYTSAESSHTMTGAKGNQLCEECGYTEKESQNDGGSFHVDTVDYDPSGTLTKTRNGTEWTFTLTSTNPDAVPDSYAWYVNSGNVEGEITNVFVLNATEKHSYRVMCVFSSNGRYSSVSVTITGGE